jgi:hypothetical protein
MDVQVLEIVLVNHFQSENSASSKEVTQIARTIS